MKVKTLFTIGLKAAGIVALWKFLFSLSGLVMSLGILSSVGFGMQGSGMILSMGLSMLLSTGLTGAIAFACLLATDSIFRMLNIDGEEVINFGADKAMMFNIVVIVAAIALIVNGATDALFFDYNINTNNQTNIDNGISHATTNVINNQSRRVNYFAFLELILGVMAIIRVSAVSAWLQSRFEPEDKGPQEWPDMYKQV
ncbi:hypothetical protein [Mucilaginibacter myungsuensis]|uniref:Uncharacterized protein n=1 Tax=Mucilaginibacter myungsuensis TaxID=649104 RepID=A0A929KUB5_9SPHI|nr:hypothetical protein [Mucilaginibacter myungsuensis]MBE9661704.1 hypothetical protein [Mucilaginibacter myungsuensis]MDN3597847.1 hypothetical protein [Mucilaginibacter myungsuensis]